MCTAVSGWLCYAKGAIEELTNELIARLLRKGLCNGVNILLHTEQVPLRELVQLEVGIQLLLHLQCDVRQEQASGAHQVRLNIDRASPRRDAGEQGRALREEGGQQESFSCEHCASEPDDPRCAVPSLGGPEPNNKQRMPTLLCPLV